MNVLNILQLCKLSIVFISDFNFLIKMVLIVIRLAHLSSSRPPGWPLIFAIVLLAKPLIEKAAVLHYFLII